MTGSSSSKPALGNSAAAILQKAVLTALSRPQTSPDLSSPDLSGPASANPAIARCTQAYTAGLRTAVKEGQNSWESERAAKAAYRDAMPPLSGPRNIRDFIACVAHAMLIQAISGSDGARLLYAAQVASAAHKAQPRKKNKPSTKSTPRPPENEQISHTILSANQAQ
jgi:hypothetical protein